MREFLVLAFNNLRNAQKRTYLTIIGIFIGIAAVVALVSLGQGLEQSINEEFNEIGADKLFISSSQDFFGTAGGDITRPLTEDDVEVIRDVRGVDAVSQYSLRSSRVEVGDDLGFYYAASMPTDQEEYELLRRLVPADIVDGRELRPGDTTSVLVGNDYTREEVFLEPVSVGDRILVNGKRYTVAGILEPLGNSIDDRIVWIPQDTFDDQYNITDTVDQIIVRTAATEDPTQVAERVELALLDERNLDAEDKDFNVQTPEDLLASFGTILTVVQVVLTGIALISLLVGGIGIMNTMYTAVLERTKEIGIMKAIGASPHDIRLIFIAESGLLGLVGGIVGILIGLGIAKLVQAIGRAAMRTDFLTAWVGWELIVGSLAFSMIVGMLSGYLPARQASRQNVVESLRYE